jgi:hypothetical protein
MTDNISNKLFGVSIPKKPFDLTTSQQTASTEGLVDTSSVVLPNIPWRNDAVASQRLLNAIDKIDFII